MVWVRLDDHIDEHPKIAQLDDHAFALFVCGLAYCNRNLTDGFIPNMVGFGQLRYCEGNTVPYIRELERVGLWETVTGGWRVHDYPIYQPSREKVLADMAATRVRVAAFRARNATSNTVTPRVTNGAGNAVTNAHVTHDVTLHPDPVPVPVPELTSPPISPPQAVGTGQRRRRRKTDDFTVEVLDIPKGGCTTCAWHQHEHFSPETRCLEHEPQETHAS